MTRLSSVNPSPPASSVLQTRYLDELISNSDIESRMILVGYSDSEGSDVEPTPQPHSSIPSKPTFQKVVDRSNPHKVRVSLPTAPAAEQDSIDKDAPPAKKAKTTGGAFSGFNSFLPAPKRSAGAPGSENSTSKGGIGKGLGRGISLKTGATPGFSKDPIPQPDLGDEGDTTAELESYNDLGEKDSLKRSEGMTSYKVAEQEESTGKNDTKPAGKPTMFKPLSVARNNKQKKPKKPVISDSRSANSQPEPAAMATISSTVSSQPGPKARTKVSLFSMSNDDPSQAFSTTTFPSETSLHQDEMPINAKDAEPPLIDPTFSDSTVPPTSENTTAQAINHQSQSLADLASTLPPAARRQLLGRNSNPAANAKILTFSPDTEATYNEEYRRSADSAAAQHNPVRGLAPGKHNLQQLVNAVATQKDALEESFASGKRNKREGGAKYGW